MIPDSTHRIQSVSIEGFKGFATQQTFDFEGRNVFLFGPNGSGKSSIVEAIRWCLFGLASRQSTREIVSNQFYPGPCIVKMVLSGPDVQLTMQRRISPSGDAPLTIYDSNGSERKLRDTFPQLSRIGPSEGAHVIYAAQQPSSRRPEANITDFRYVIYQYLGLEEVPQLSEKLLKLSKEWQPKEDEMFKEADKLRDKIQQRLTDVADGLTRIISNPPWGKSKTPTNAQTRDKIDLLAGEAESLGVDFSREAFEGYSLGAKLSGMENAVQRFLSGQLLGVSGQLRERSRRLENAKSSLKQAELANDQMTGHSRSLTLIREKLEAVLNGTHLGDLQDSLANLDKNLEAQQLKLDAMRSTIKYLETTSDPPDHATCPICDGGLHLEQLSSRVQDWETNGDQSGILENRSKLRGQITKAQELDLQQENVKKQLDVERNNLAKALEFATGLGLPSPSTIESLRSWVEALSSGYEQLESAQQSQAETLRGWESKVSNLRRELEFHTLRSRKGHLQGLSERHDALNDKNHKDLAYLRDAVVMLRSHLNGQLCRELDQALPSMEQEMTEVYLRLTERPKFDAVKIHRGEDAVGEITLELHVSSSRAPRTSWRVDRGILNGQALNAVHLVPYFVFSRYQDSPLLDLLLLDDPTQSFDTEKIQLLLTELSNATSHATLFVATHEVDRFYPYLSDFFDQAAVKTYRAIDIGEDGPAFEEISITL